jgi:hypothetical protein
MKRLFLILRRWLFQRTGAVAGPTAHVPADAKRRMVHGIQAHLRQCEGVPSPSKASMVNTNERS